MIYYAQAEQKDVPGHIDWLHLSEQSVFEEFQFEKRRRDWLLGRWTAKNLLQRSWYQELDLNQIEIRAGENRAPFIFVENQIQKHTISISHSHSRALCATAEEKYLLGCDLEKVEERSEFFYKDYFSINEHELFIDQVSPNLGKSTYFSLCWSAKESVMKALRTGMKTHPLKIEVTRIHLNVDGWNNIVLILKDNHKFFYGFWKMKEGFVFVVLSNNKYQQLK